MVNHISMWLSLCLFSASQRWDDDQYNAEDLWRNFCPSRQRYIPSYAFQVLKILIKVVIESIRRSTGQKKSHSWLPIQTSLRSNHSLDIFEEEKNGPQPCWRNVSKDLRNNKKYQALTFFSYIINYNSLNQWQMTKDAENKEPPARFESRAWGYGTNTFPLGHWNTLSAIPFLMNLLIWSLNFSHMCEKLTKSAKFSHLLLIFHKKISQKVWKFRTFC